ncbi:MAG: hypothetical protein PVF17_12060 [Ignavibacteria bacterium]|jgi:hypothetical protein
MSIWKGSIKIYEGCSFSTDLFTVLVSEVSPGNLELTVREIYNFCGVHKTTSYTSLKFNNQNLSKSKH